MSMAQQKHALPTIDLTGHRALVTGASRGIGRGIVTALAAAGCAVCAVARTQPGLNETARAAHDSRGTVRLLRGDLADPQTCAELPVAATAVPGGPPDILVHNAGCCVVSEDH
jgi:NAD(P)-dependent dehydrogenase (short-subunit alcohol dehydrogenase family)